MGGWPEWGGGRNGGVAGMGVHGLRPYLRFDDIQLAQDFFPHVVDPC